MTCEELEVFISAYIDDELPDDDRRTVEAHLASCQDCGEVLADFSRIHRLYGELEELQAPKGFRERVTQRVETPSHTWFGRPLKSRGLRHALSYVLLLMLVGGVWFWQTREQPTQPPEETLLAGDIDVLAEDILFGDEFFEESGLFSEEDAGVADDILNTFFLGEADTSGILGETEFIT